MHAIDIDSLRPLIAEGLRASAELDRLLEQEQTLLRERDSVALEAVLADKQATLSALDTLSKRRDHLLANAGFNDPERGWQLLLEQADSDLQDQWRQLRAQLSRCHQANERNGRAIARNRQTVHRLLDILRGQPEPAGLYTAGGDTQPSGNGQRIGSA